MGATVRCFIADFLVGEGLRMLEFEADLHLIRREMDAEKGGEWWYLRSDRFPSDLEGREIVLQLTRDDDQVDRLVGWTVPNP